MQVFEQLFFKIFLNLNNMQHINLPRSNAFEARLNCFNWEDEKLKSKAFECLRTMKEAERKQIKMNNKN